MIGDELRVSRMKPEGPEREEKRLSETVIWRLNASPQNSDFFPIYFNTLDYWCPEEDSNLHALASAAT